VEQQIEGPHGDVIVGGSAEMQRVEVEKAEGVEGGHLPVDEGRPRREQQKRSTKAHMSWPEGIFCTDEAAIWTPFSKFAHRNPNIHTGEIHVERSDLRGWLLSRDSEPGPGLTNRKRP
jgi:hypothetical protein